MDSNAHISFNGRADTSGGLHWTGDVIGQSIALSTDGNRVIVGTDSKDKVGVYELNPDTDTWTIVGDFIKVGDGEDKFGHSVTISRDGTRIAIGAPYVDTPDAPYNGNNKGATRVYVWSLKRVHLGHVWHQ